MIQKEILKCNLSKKSRDKVWSGSWFASSSPRGGRRGGTWIFFGWVCAARESKLAPRSKKISPKIDIQFLEVGQFFIPRSRIRPKTDTPF